VLTVRKFDQKRLISFVGWAIEGAPGGIVDPFTWGD
jgi:hypothetical protein